MFNKEKEIYEEVIALEKAHELEEQGGTYSGDGLQHIENNGNVTRQIMNAIGMDSLLTCNEKRKELQN